MKKIPQKILAITVMAFVVAATVVIAGALTDRSATFTGTSYYYTNTTGNIMYVEKVKVAWAAAVSNKCDLYIADADGNAFLVDTTEVQADMQYCTFSPTGNGKIVLAKNGVLRIAQTSTNQARVIISPTKPE